MIETPKDSAGNALAVGNRVMVVKSPNEHAGPLGAPYQIEGFGYSAVCANCGWRYVGWVANMKGGGAPCEWLLKLPDLNPLDEKVDQLEVDIRGDGFKKEKEKA